MPTVGVGPFLWLCRAARLDGRTECHGCWDGGVISAWQAFAVFALTATEWIAVAAVFLGGTFVSQGLAARSAVKERRKEKQDETVAQRTVLWDEVQGTYQMMRATILQQSDDLREERRRCESCEAWRKQHIAECPLFGGGRIG